MIQCPLPFMHQFIGQNFTKPCCEFTEQSSQTPNQYWHSNELAKIRNDLLTGKWPIGCKTCKTLEANKSKSLRQRSCEEYTIPSEPQVKYIDVRFSNKCNFACRSCEPIFSSRISKENSLHNLEEFYGYKLDKNYVNNSKQIANDIEKYLPTLEKIMFTGGEPTYIEEFYTILEKIINKDIQVCITTNASLISERFLKAVSKIKKLHITISLDAVGQHAEYIRYGTVWSTVEENIQKILKLKCSVMFNSVITAYSLPHLDKLVDFIIKNEQNEYGADMYICNNPNHLHPCVLPKKSRIWLTEVINYCILKLTNSIRVEDYRNCIDVLKDLKIQLSKNFYDEKKFKLFTNKLDKIRNQKYDNRNLWTNW